MTKVMIVADRPHAPDTTFRAIAREAESVGPTPGAALDALNEQLGGKEAGSLIVLQNLGPDEFFTAAQQQRMEALLVKWRAARSGGASLGESEQAELESLVNAELDGSARRAAAMARELRT